MSASYDLKAAVPGTDVPDSGDGPASCPVLTVHPKRK
jgi:hypothetical protein